MPGWYQCADVLSAVYAYDALGVEPGPADAGYSPLQRSMHLSTVSTKIITQCYNRTMQCVGENTEQARCVIKYYDMLQGKSRESYDMRRFRDNTQAHTQKYSKCIVLIHFEYTH